MRKMHSKSFKLNLNASISHTSVLYLWKPWFLTLYEYKDYIQDFYCYKFFRTEIAIESPRKQYKF